MVYSTVFSTVISSIVVLGLIVGWRKALALKLIDSMDIKVHRVINHTSTSRCYFLEMRGKEKKVQERREKGGYDEKKEYVITKMLDYS